MGGRLRALDGLRALSVLGVFLSGYHWLIPFGWIGVLVFYVLSGFLITRILLQERAHARQGDQPAAGSYFKRFYFRRTLRIFPLYFAYLLVLQLSHWLRGAPEGWDRARPFALLYAVNFGLITGDVPMVDAYGHLWTLSVEEQFYVVWPLVVWLTSRATLLRLSIALVLLGPLVRFASTSLFGLSVEQLYLSSFSHLDAFAVGAVLATHDFAGVKRASRFAIVAGGITLGLGLAVKLTTGAAFRTLGYAEGLLAGGAYIWGYTVLDVCSGFVILAALRGELPMLSARPLSYLGRISYGIYLAQRPIKRLYQDLLEPLVISITRSHALALVAGAVLCLGAATTVAALSYRFFEAPLLRYRDRKLAPLRAVDFATPSVPVKPG
jgi:peptidoglycan/LPS O-acetylase OafA/YrhL